MSQVQKMLPIVDLYCNDDAYQVKVLINWFRKSSITKYRKDKNWKYWLVVEKEIRVLVDFRLIWLPTCDFLLKSTIFVLTTLFRLTHIYFVFLLISRKFFSKNMSFDRLRKDYGSNTSTNTCTLRGMNNAYIKIIFTYYYLFCVYYVL